MHEAHLYSQSGALGDIYVYPRLCELNVLNRHFIQVLRPAAQNLACEHLSGFAVAPHQCGNRATQEAIKGGALYCKRHAIEEATLKDERIVSRQAEIRQAKVGR